MIRVVLNSNASSYYRVASRGVRVFAEDANSRPPWEFAKDPSPPAAEAMQSIAIGLLKHLDENVEELQKSVDRVHAASRLAPEARAVLFTSIRAIVESWLVETARVPAKVHADVPWEMFQLARMLWGSGRFTASDFRAAFHFGQNAGWRLWQQAAVREIDDQSVLAEVLEVSSASIFEYAQGMSENIVKQMLLEEAASVSPKHDRLERVERVLFGGLGEEEASWQLGYELDRPHTCLIVWSEHEEPLDHTHLIERIAATTEDTSYGLLGHNASIWLWLSGDQRPDSDRLKPILGDLNARAAIGEQQTGLSGFRRSFDTAISVQTLMKMAPTDRRIATYEDVAIVTLAGYHRAEAKRFVHATLGDLAEDSEQAEELRETMRVYLQVGESGAQAAERLHTHRNTVHHRLSRIRDLLGEDYRERRLAIAAALELADWFGV